MLNERSENAQATEAWVAAQRQGFHEAIEAFSPTKPILLLSHHDADGLSAAAILARALERGGRQRHGGVIGAVSADAVEGAVVVGAHQLAIEAGERQL